MTTTATLTDAEREHWDQNGFLLIRNCLDDAEVAGLTASMGALAEEAEGWSPEKRRLHTSTAGNGKHVDLIGLPFLTDAADRLMDHPNLFGKILSLMGPFIYSPGMEYLERHSHNEQVLRLHTDGGGSLRCIFPSPESLVLQLKVQIFLTDNDKPESGNFMMVPASHRTRFPLGASQIEEATRKAVPVLARKGDALIFPWSLWHAVSANRSTQVRKSIITRYSQLWMRPVDYDFAPEVVSQRLTPRRRRLLADIPECRTQNDFYRPNIDDQVDVMFGQEWRDHPDLPRYIEMKKPIKLLFEQ